MRQPISKRWAISILLMLAVMMALGGCVTVQPGDDTPAAPPQASGTISPVETTPLPTRPPVTPLPPEEAQALWQRIQARGEMIVGVSADYPPFAYHDPDGQLDGFDIALMKALGDRLGVDVSFEEVPFDILLDKVQAGEVDAAVGGIAITPERAGRVAFTEPYLTGDTALLANADADIGEIASVEDLAELRIAAEMGTNFGNWLLAQVDAGTLPAEHVSLYPDMDQALTALVTGKTDLVMADAFTAKDIARQTRGKLQLLNRRGRVTLTYLPLVDKPLQGTPWVLSAYANEEGDLVPALTGVDVTAFIDDAVIKGSAGCNTYSADYLLKEKGIRITLPVITRKTCAEPEGVMDQENQFLVDLRNSEAYQIEGDTLVLMDAKGHVTLIFKAKPVVDLANITWKLYAYGPVLRPFAVPKPVEITLTVDQDGNVSGSSGCNNYTGKATVDGDAVRFELGAATMKACDPTTNSMEAAYLTALAGVTRGELQQDRLILYYNGGLDALKFQATHSNPLQFSDWELLSFGKPEREKFPLPTTQLTALFGKENLTGSAGCNTFTTGYSVRGNKLKIGKITLTPRLCPDKKVTKQEADYVKALRNSVKYRFIGVKVATTGLYQQAYGIAVPPGADELLAKLNEGLAQMSEEDVLGQLEQRYLPLAPAAAEPTPTPSASCIDKMTWIADLTYDDHNMKHPPVVEPGTPFTKKWRVKNTGTCTWTTDYYLDFVRGNKPGADMGGRRTYLDREVRPGETYDLALDLVAPVNPGVYQGFWQFFNAQGKSFAELWVGIRVPKPVTPIPTATPTPTAVPAPILQLTADSTHIQQGACTNLYWSVQGASETYLFEEGEDWQGKQVAPQGSQEVCPQQTTTYILGAVLPDGSRQATSLTVTVSPVNPPEIVSFTANPSDRITLGSPVQLHWDVRGDVQRVQLLVNHVPLDANAPVYGSWLHYPQQLGTVKYTLQAEGPGGVSVSDVVIEVVAQTPPTATSAPPTATPLPPTATPLPPTATPAPEPTATPVGNDITNQTWYLQALGPARSNPRPVLGKTEGQVTLFLGPLDADNSGTYSGFGGCNNFQGQYQILGPGEIQFEAMNQSQMICDQDIMDQESLFFQILVGATSYTLGPSTSGEEVLTLDGAPGVAQFTITP